MFKKIVAVSLFLMAFTSVADEEQQHFEAALATVAMPQGEKLDQMIDGLLAGQIQANPQMQTLRGAFETFYREVFQSEDFLHGLAKIQMELFTYEELLEIKKMMETPVFKRYEEQMPLFIQRNMELGQQVVFAKQDRLISLIQAEQARIEELKKLDKELNLTGAENQ